MEPVTYESLFILCLILINGFFAMSEIAIISARRERLQILVQKGDVRAKIALELAETESKFLSAIQIGITLVSIFAGVYSGATIAKTFSNYLMTIPFLSKYAYYIGFSVVIVSITLLALIIGELVPKQIGRRYAEVVAMRVAKPMKLFLLIIHPIAALLSFITNLILKLIGSDKPKDTNLVSDEELLMLIEQGAKYGSFEEEEKNMFKGVLDLDKTFVSECMTPVAEMDWIDIQNSYEENLSILSKTTHTNLPVGDGSYDKILGVLHVKSILANIIEKKPIHFLEKLNQIIFIPENTTLLDALIEFSKHKFHFGMVISEYGSIKGMITSHDIFEEMLGKELSLYQIENPDEMIKKREDGSYLIDGSFNLGDFANLFAIHKSLIEEVPANTVAGLALWVMNAIPRTGDKFTWENLSFEIVDMDGKRIDKLLIYQSMILTNEYRHS